MSTIKELVGKIDYKIPTWLWRCDEEGYCYARILALIGKERSAAFYIKAPLLMIPFPTGEPREASLVSMTFQDAGEHGFVIDLIYRFRGRGFIEKIKSILDAHVSRGCLKDYLIVEPKGMVIPNPLVKRYSCPTGGRMFIQYETFYKGLFSRLIKEYGQLGGLMLERIGEGVAQEYVEWLKKRGVTRIRDALEIITATGSSLGLYTLKALKTFRTPKDYIVEVIVEDLFEEVIYWREGLKEKSHYQLGFMKGIIKGLTGLSDRDFTLIETKSYNERDKESVFIVKIPLDKLREPENPHHRDVRENPHRNPSWGRV